MMFEPLLSGLIPEQIITYLVLWGVLDIIYLAVLLFNSDCDVGDAFGDSLISTMISDTYHNMTKFGLFVMKPIVFMIMILEFGGISLLVVYLMINLWFIPVGVVLIALFSTLLYKLIYKS